MRKTAFGVCDQVRHKPGCTDGWRLGYSDLGSRGIVLSMERKQRRGSDVQLLCCCSAYLFLHMSHFTKMKEFGRKKSKKITQLILILFLLKLKSKHLTTIIHSFRQEISNNNNFRFILMAAHLKNVIPVTTTMNRIS